MRKLLTGALLVGLMSPTFAAADEHDATSTYDAAPVADPLPAPAPERVVVEKERPFLDKVDWQLFASGQYMFNAHRVSGPYNSAGYPYTNSHGFGLNFAGADASYMDDEWGLTLNLRYGQGAAALTPLDFVKQAYVTWMPTDKLTLDLGWWDTIYGAEVADEWENVNYSRGALYFQRQPFNHMGLRIGYAVSDKVGLTFLVANGGVSVTGITVEAAAGLGGSPTDFDQVPSFGAQASLALTDDFNLVLGYLTGPNGTSFNGAGQSKNRDWGHFIDIVATLGIDDFALIFNADFTFDPEPLAGADLGIVYGFSLAGVYSFNEHWSAGARVEFLGGNDDAGEVDYFVTITPTVRYSPIEHLIFSIEPRLEFAEQDIYFSRNSPVTMAGPVADEKVYFGLILGATAKIGN